MTLSYFTLGNPLRQYSLRFFNSWLRKLIDTVMILAFALISSFIDFDTMSSRQTAWLNIDSTSFRSFLYVMHAWFMINCINGFVALGIIHGQGSFMFNYLNAQDFILSFIGLVRVDFLPSLSILRMFRVLHYLSLMPSMEFLNDIIQLIVESIGLLASSIGIMIISSLFLAMFINNLIVDTHNQENQLYTSRCRFMTAEGHYKINDTLNYLCDYSPDLPSCPTGSLCLSNSSPILRQAGIDNRDLSAGALAFDNIFECMVYLFKILTYDSWSSVMMLLVNSNYNGWMLTALFAIVIVLSAIIHGLIIANFLNTALKIKNKKV